MVVLSQPALDQFTLIKTCKPKAVAFSPDVPIIDLRNPEARSLMVKACEEFGFFRLVNHGVPLEYMSRLEALAMEFFSLPQSDKDRAGPPDPFGYGNKKIGPNGDVGWIEYLLLDTNPHVNSVKTLGILQDAPHAFRSAVEDYLSQVKRMASEVLEMVAEGLGIEQRNVFSKMLKDEKSDSCFRINHYPPCPDQLQALSGRNLVGFGEHTDPQIISVLRSNNTTGLQICLRDGTWVSVPPDHTSFFFNVGDALQVMTNGRFMSVKHRVISDPTRSRVSMIYFGAPPLSEKIAPIPSVMEAGEEGRYKEFTWCEYKNSAYKSRLADYRLGQFEKNGGQQL